MKARYWILTGVLAAVAFQAPATPGGPVIVAEDGEVLTAKEQLKEPGRRPPPLPPGLRPDPAKDIAAAAKSGNYFATELYAQLAGKNEGNLFFSPASIHTALAMTYAGARGNTEKQMHQTLRLPRTLMRNMGKHVSLKDGTGYFEDLFVPLPQERVHPAFAALIKKLNAPRLDHEKKPAYQLVIANALWGQKGYPWREQFIKVTKDNYGAGLNHVDFIRQAEPARLRINEWVEKQTKDKIKNLIPKGAIDSLTRLVLTNAIYFKSNWAEKFQKGATRDEAFTLSPGKTVKTPMMHQQKRHGYLETDTFQAVELSYRFRDLSMVVFLPKTVDGLAAFEKTLTAENLAGWLGQLKRETVKLTLPKFEFTSQFGLADTLKAMGMTDAFSLATADFSGMTTAENLFISAVIHKAFVAVDEEGTEAAAATAVVMWLGAAPRPKEPKVFKADHPFVFMIRHRATGSILFMGRVTNPKGS